MKIKISESLVVPAGIDCKYEEKTFFVSKSGLTLSKKMSIPSVNIEVKEGKTTFSADKGSKNEVKYIKSAIAHLKNLFAGLDKKYVYSLESCNVHFPMTLKLESGNLVISNFLGERVSRKAKILPGVEVELKGPKITVSSHNKEFAGETATNIEKATKIKNRDRRVFQDGIFIVSKPQGESK